MQRGAPWRWAFVLSGCAALAATDPRAPGTERDRRLQTLQDEMTLLRGEMSGLAAKEQGVLGDVTRLDVEIALRRTQVEDVSVRLAGTQERLSASSHELEQLTADQARRAPRLAARMREVYKRGPAGLLARVLAPLEGGDGLDGVRYAAYLSRRDGRQLSAWRATSVKLADERTTLDVERARLTSLRADAVRHEAELEESRAARAALLARIRGDREQRQKAIGELQDAAQNLGKLVDSFEGLTKDATMDVHTFRGLLDWPAEGPVTAKFGTTVHPKFKTEVPHPGLDIDAPEGRVFRSVFDGRVAYAAQLPGYGLTVVVEHGNGVMSVYAHASVLVVAAGDGVTRGQELGRVGESGSLRGPYLYFELRDGGRPVDPIAWLRRR